MQEPREAALLRPRDLLLRDRSLVEARIRALCTPVYLGDDSALCRVLGRYKMYVDSRDADLSAHLLLDGFWELWVVETLVQTVRSGMTCVDIGAHLGFFSLLMADLAGETGRVHAFEPNHALRLRLADSIALNGFARRTVTHDMPLSDRDGVAARLQVPARQPGHGHVELMPADARPADWPLRTRRADSIEGIDAPDIVKIDAEGSEEAIWRGMAGWFAQDRPMTVLLEFAPTRYADPAAFLAAIAAEGFGFAIADPKLGPQAATPAAIANSDADDLMLVLTR
jgi:FkbM family methyltransferase